MGMQPGSLTDRTQTKRPPVTTLADFDDRQATYAPPYGDVTELNTCRVILDAVGKDMLQEIAEDAIDLLETSVAVYEANGDYAFGMFSSGWCRVMDLASRRRCRTDDNAAALNCGKWLCHENCWNDSARAAMESGRSTDIPCIGGIHLYAEPIFAGDRIIGAINIGYGDPPRDPDRLRQLAKRFDVDVELLRNAAQAYPPRPPFMADLAKKRLKSWARLIGDTVEKVETQARLRAARDREQYLNTAQHAIRSLNRLFAAEKDPPRLIEGICASLTGSLGYRTAWIALLDDADTRAAMVAAAGFEGGFGRLRERLMTGRFCSCMKPALETGTLQVIQHPETQCPDCPVAAQYAGSSGFTARLAADGRLFGILSASVPVEYADDAQAQALFLDLAQEISLALRGLEAEKEVHLLQAVFHAVPCPMSFVSREYRYQAVNDVYTEFFGVDKAAIIGRRASEFIPSNEFESAVKPHFETCLTGKTVQYECTVDFPGMGRRSMQMIYTPYETETGEVAGVISHGVDITERRQLEERLRESEHKFRTLFDASPQAIAVTDNHTGRFLDVNEMLCHLSRYTKEELIGKTTTELGFYSQKDRARFIEELTNSGRVDGLAMDFRVKDGAVVSTRMFAELVQIQGQPVILTSFFDATALNRLEAERRRAHRMEAVACLTGGIAHDYNNLLTAILGNLTFAKEAVGLDKDTLDALEEAEDASLKVRDLTHRLMTLSGGNVMQRAPGSIREVLEQSVRGTLHESPVEFQLNVPENLRWVKHDSRQLRYAIENVLQNAVEATPAGGVVTISARNRWADAGRREPPFSLNEGDWIQISIQDQGPGIGEAVMDRIFDPYFSTKPRGNQKGMGLGLPVADAIVRNHGGYIDMASRPGKGTDVKIILPAWQSDKTNARAAQSRARARKTEGPSRGKRVLVMDDERGVRMLTERVLQRMGCDTEAVSEGRKAIEAYKQALDQGRPFDAVILDLTNKDGMGGLDALKGLQKIDPAVKAVVASGYSADPVMREFRANGFRGAVTKPFDLNDFEQLMKDVLEEP